MKKVLVGFFNAECNANMPLKATLAEFDIAYGDLCVDKMYIRDVFANNEIEIIPSIYANAGGTGIVTYDAFDSIETYLINTIKNHLDEIDGIYLHLHGASYVENGIGSGDHHILDCVRKIVGPYLPICVSCDPHGNLTQKYVEQSTLIRSFRESPHTDNVATYQKVAQMCCDLVKNRQHIHSVYRKLPLILGGEQSVSLDEPVLSINQYMNKLEEDDRILSASWHVGYLRHDCPEAGCGIVVVPSTEKDIDYANDVADCLADYVFEKRHEFHYTGLTANPNDALKMCLDYEESPVVLTDSGDNMTSGAPGWNTYVLNQVLNCDTNKSFLFAPIYDPKTYNELLNYGERVHKINLGVNHDIYSKPIDLDVEVKNFVKIAKFTNGVFEKEQGDAVVVDVVDHKVTLIIAKDSLSLINNKQLEYMNLDWHKYDILVVKQGYIFPDFKKDAKFYVMSLTNGATPQNTKDIDFKLVMRPMYPLDEI